MRKILLTVVMATLVCLPVMAQFRGPGMGDMSAILLTLEDVQKELKLTADQKTAIASASKERREAFTKAREDMDMEGFQKAQEGYTKAIAKVKDGLKSDQKKRLLGIEVQVAEKNKTAAIFKNAVVVKALAMTDKQKETLKELLSDNEKDAKELFEDAKAAGDFSKFREVGQKVQKMSAATYTKVSKGLSEKQVEAWKELKGEKFEVVFPKGGGFKGKDKPKEKKTDDL